MDISEGLPVWVESCAAGDQGTGRCRLSRIALRALGLRPGDGVIVRPLRSSRLFLCAACLAPATSDIGRGEDFGARTGGNGAESVQVDGCIELPAAPLSLTAAPGANEPACGRPGSREHGETQGLGAVHAFRRSTAPAASVRLRANGFGGDPAARVRVAIASALNGHLVCQGAQLVIPEVGTIVVTETSPARCAVTIIARTRISFAPSSGPSSTPPPPPMDDHGITTLNTPSTPTSPPRCSQSPVDAPSTPPTSLPSHSPSQSPATVATASLHANMPLRALANHLPFSPASPMAPRSKPQVYRAQPRPTPEQTLSGAEDAICTLREVMTGMWVEQARLTGVGITPSKGVLVHGPRGTGKTALAQAMVEEFDAALLVVTAAEVSQGGAGEGEEVLRRVFAAAEDSPRVVILLEDLDLMCPTREVGRDAQARVVAQLLLLMDGAKEAGRGVMWVGTTSQPNRVDGALRRPGRFDREVALAVPTQVQRTAILQRCLAQMTAPIAADVCLDSIARATVGFVGATIKALCAHAAAASILRQSSPRARGVQDGAPDATGVAGGIGSCGGQVAAGREALEIGAQDFAKALVQVRHAALVVEGDGAGAGGENGVSQGLDAEIGGLEDVKTVLRQAIEWPLLRADRLRAFGVRPSRGVLLHGPPGCGKTSLVRAAASVSGVGFLRASGAELFSAFLGESERIVRDLFARARALQPCVLFLDEIDAIVSRRSLEGSADGAEAGGVQQRILSTILNELDGIDSAEGVVLVGATNRLDMIDAALLRPGRFDHVVPVPQPDAAGRAAILRLATRRIPLAADVDLTAVAHTASSRTGAEMTRVCKEAALAALREDRAATVVSARHFERALSLSPAG